MRWPATYRNPDFAGITWGSLSDLLFRNGLIGILARGEHSYDRPIPPAPLSFAVLGFGQIGVYGPVATHLKAGDFSPDITFVETLNGPASASWSQANLSGHLTVLAFFPDTSNNLQSVALWNAVVEKFAGKPVHFAWTTSENRGCRITFTSLLGARTA